MNRLYSPFQDRGPTYRIKLWQTLSAFIREAGLSPEAGIIEKGDLTIEKILEEKKVFDLSLRFEKTGLEDGEEWSLPGRSSYLFTIFISIFASNATSSAPSVPNQISTLPSATNLLHVSVENFHGETPFQLLLVSYIFRVFFALFRLLFGSQGMLREHSTST